MRTLRLVLAGLLFASTAHAVTSGFSRPAVMLQCPEARSPAKDWTQNALFRGIYTFEEDGPDLSVGWTRDTSSNTNDLGEAGSPRATRSLFVRQGCRSYNSNSTIRRLDCDGVHCDPADFCPVMESFTVGCWVYPFDGVATTYDIASADVVGGDSGYRLGWKQTVGSVGNLFFDLDRTSVASPTTLLNFSTLSADTWYHHVGRYLFNGVSNGTMNQVIDGTVDTLTATTNGITACDMFTIGTGFFLTTLQGYMDECFYAAGALDDPTICRITICGIDGKGCSCDEADPTLYDYAPLHSSSGGPITCTLPLCDADPVLLTTTTTSTSVTTTSTSTTSTTSTSSTTTTLAACADWSDETAMKAGWLMNEDFSVFSTNLVDTSPATNNLETTDLNISNATTNIFEGAKGFNITSSGAYHCSTDASCTLADFDFGSGTGDFTCFIYVYPTDGTVPLGIFGYSAGVSTVGGWAILRQAGPVYSFCVGVSGGSFLCKDTTTAATTNVGHMVVVQRQGTTAKITLDGAAWEATGTLAGDITPTGGDVQIGATSGVGSLLGNYDYAGCWSGALDLPSIRKILVCGADSASCTGSGASYTTCARHAASGGCGDSTGIITGTMADCNQASPSLEP